MNEPLRVGREEGSLILRIPAQVARTMNLKEGDLLHLVRTAYGHQLSTLSQDDLEALGIAEEVMEQYDSALRKLADS